MEYYNPEIESPEEYISRIEDKIGYRPATMSSILMKCLPYRSMIQAHRIVMMSAIGRQMVPIKGMEVPYLIPRDSYHLPEIPGLHLRTAFMLWNGWNLEDAAVISASAAAKMSTNVIGIERLQCLSDPEVRVSIGDQVHRSNILATWRTEDTLHLFHNRRPVPGTVIKVEKYTEMRGTTIVYNLRVHIEMKYLLDVGSKISNLHASKSIISTVVPDRLMPYDEYGPVELIVSPYAIARRMAPSTIMEVMMNTLCKCTSKKFGPSRFIVGKDDDPTFNEVANMIEAYDLPGDCMYQLYDGRSHEPYPNRTLVGPMFIGRLWHHAEDKIRFREEVSEDYHGIPRRGTGAQSIKREEIEAILQYGNMGMIEECRDIQSRSNTKSRIDDLLKCIGVES